MSAEKSNTEDKIISLTQDASFNLERNQELESNISTITKEVDVLREKEKELDATISSLKIINETISTSARKSESSRKELEKEIIKFEDNCNSAHERITLLEADNCSLKSKLEAR